MTIEPVPCPDCHGPMRYHDGYAVEAHEDEYYFSYYQCSPCDLWYEESHHDRFCGPDEVKLYVIPLSEVHRRLAERS